VHCQCLAGAIQFDRLKNKQSPDFMPSRLFIYFNERQIEGHVANDAGAQLRDGIKTLNKLGVCPEKDWSYDDTPALYEGGPFPPNSKPAEKPDQASYQDAVKYVITNYQRLTPTLSQLQGCLARVSIRFWFYGLCKLVFEKPTARRHIAPDLE